MCVSKPLSPEPGSTIWLIETGSSNQQWIHRTCSSCLVHHFIQIYWVLAPETPQPWLVLRWIRRVPTIADPKPKCTLSVRRKPSSLSEVSYLIGWGEKNLAMSWVDALLYSMLPLFWRLSVTVLISLIQHSPHLNCSSSGIQSWSTHCTQTCSVCFLLHCQDFHRASCHPRAYWSSRVLFWPEQCL